MDVWLQNYQQPIGSSGYEKNIKRRNLNSCFANISKTISATSCHIWTYEHRSVFVKLNNNYCCCFQMHKLFTIISHDWHVKSNSDKMVDVDSAVWNKWVALANAGSAMYFESEELIKNCLKSCFLHTRRDWIETISKLL